MPIRTKFILLMLFPLLLAFIGLAFAIGDLKHPVIRHDHCQLVGRGESIQNFKENAKSLYGNNGHPQDDLAFTCNQLGPVVINEIVPLPLPPGAPAQLTIKQFKFLPQRFRMDLPVVNP